MDYAAHFNTRSTPQSDPVPGKAMAENNAGGFAFEIDDWKRLDRFLVLGSEGGTYYVAEKELTVDNAKCVLRCLDADPLRTVARVAEISESGRAPKNDAAVFALAMAFGHKKAKDLPSLSGVLARVCRTGTHLFQFVEAVQKFRGWGRSLRRAVGDWYTAKAPRDLAYQCVKYQSRNGWSHRDVLRKCHPRAGGALGTVLRWAAGKADPDNLLGTPDLETVVAFERSKKAATEAEVIRLVRDHGLPREGVMTKWLNSPAVWEALLEKMPLTAMIRNLGKMTHVGLLTPMSQAVGRVVGELANVERLRKSRVHPLAVLVALKTYAQGHGEKGRLSWTPVPKVIDALDGAFYNAFGNVTPTGKRWYLGVDVSGSMWCSHVAGMTGVTAGYAAAAMAMITAAVEPDHYIAAFTDTMVRFSATPKSRLDDVAKDMGSLPFGRTDCAKPMLDAAKHNIPADVFVVLTDCETWAGPIHPCQALTQYRQKTGIPAKMIVVGMTATQFSIADPDDQGSLDVVGFDTATPQVMSDFVAS